MMKIKKMHLVLFALTLVFTLFLAGCGADAEPAASEDEAGNDANDGAEEEDVASEADTESYTFKIGHVAPPNHSYSLGLEQYAELIDERTDGQVQFEIYGDSQLGGERDLTEQIQLGTLDMGLITSGPVGNFVPEISVLEMPFIFRDVDHVYNTLDGDIGDELLAQLEDAGFKGLGFWENGFRHLSNNKHEIRAPEDLDGLVMRTIENEIFVDTYRALGADATPIAWPEVYTSVQQGVVDGFDASYGVFESTKMYEVQDYFSEASIYYASALLLINLDLYNSLPADIQEIMLDTGKEFAADQRALNQEMEEEQKQNMLDNGVEIIDAADMDIDPFRDALQDVYETHSGSFGDYVERIQAVQ